MHTLLRGRAKKTIQKIRDYYGSGWVGPGLTRNFVCVENHPKTALNQYRHFGVVYTICILSVYTLLKVVRYYDLSVLFMRVMGFQKKVWMGGGVGGWDELYPRAIP